MDYLHPYILLFYMLKQHFVDTLHCTMGEIEGHIDIAMLSNFLPNISSYEPLLVFFDQS